ncbi:MAG: VOC family protein [Candidatus Saccharimonadales bacterium]
MSKLFVNLPIKDLEASVAFFTKLGFTFNPQFTDDKAACMIVGDDAFVMLLTNEFFETFTKKSLADATLTTEVIVAVSAESKEAVDTMVEAALENGGKESNRLQDQGFMYSWSFKDPDDHLWEVIWMDPATIES